MENKQKNLPILILKFSYENLLDAFYTGYYSKERIENSILFKYLFNFLKYTNDKNELIKDGHDAKTIVIEEDYVSETFLKDYSYYYTECFKDYKRKTRRVHFFEYDFSENPEYFEDLCINNNAKIKSEIKKSYLGYIVIKPISNSFVGASLLKPYKRTSNKKRFYNSILDHTVYIFSLKINNFNSLVFQEQDNAVSACATSALWSAFQKTSQMFFSTWPAPSQITSSAGFPKDGGRIFPNKGLENRQISNAIEATGLVAEMVVRTDSKDTNPESLQNRYLKRHIYAYNKIGIPILLGYQIDGKNENHLITVVGFRIDDNKYNDKRDDSEDLILYSDRISCLYAHNDQVGPFTKISFENCPDNSNKIISTIVRTEKKWGYSKSLIVPILSTIRLKFEDIRTVVEEINIIVNIAKGVNERPEIGLKGKYPEKEEYKCPTEWDIYLEYSRDYKSEIYKAEYYDDVKKKIIFQSYPKYIWLARAGAFNKDKKYHRYFDIVFDPSDTPTGFYFFQVNYFDNLFKEGFGESIDFYFDEVKPTVKKHIKSTKSDENKNLFKDSVLSLNHKLFFKKSLIGEETEFYKEPNGKQE